MKIVYFDIAAIAILLIILLSAYFRKLGSNNGNRAFLVSVTEILLTSVFDYCALVLDNAGTGNIIGKYIFHTLYLWCHTLTALFYLCYLISLTDSWSKLLQRKLRSVLIFIPATVYTGVVILNALGIVNLFRIAEGDIYTRGSMFFMGYVVGAVYMTVGLAYIILYKKLFTPRWIFMLFSPYPFIAAAMAIQFFNSRLVIELFFNALTMLFIYTNIQTSEDLTDPYTGMWSVAAHEDYAHKVYFNQRDMSVILVDIRNMTVFRSLLEFNDLHDFLHESGRKIQQAAASFNIRVSVYSGQQGRFYIYLPNQYPKETIEEFSEEILKLFNRYITFLQDKDSTKFVANIDSAHQSKGMGISSVNQASRQVKLRLESCLCLVSVPQDISDVEAFIRFTESEFTNLMPGKVHLASELYKDTYYRIRDRIPKMILDALESGHFEVYYQPIYSCRLKRFVSAEALIRLKDPDHGFISPGWFIPVAEHNGMIRDISDFVLHSVCSFISEDIFEKLGLDYIEVNLSAYDCIQDHLADRILSIIERHGVTSDRLSLEITETALIFDPDKLNANLDILHSNGFSFCLDDYGTGYSDTRRIIDLPLKIIKLDRSFLNGIEMAKNRIIVKDTIQMIKDIGCGVVAEGVETKDMLNLLQECGCDEIQGYYFSKPLPKDEFIALCLKQNASSCIQA